jgi:hypothetical protein
VQAVAERPSPPDRPNGRVRPGPGSIAVPLGVTTTLVGVIGDLLSHTLNAAAHEHEELLVLGRGNNPWHLVLFAGILLTAIGGIRWASHLPSDFGALLGAGMVLLLVATVVLGGWSGWKASHEVAASAADHASNGSSASGATSAAAHDHGAGSGQAGAVVTGEGSEGGSHFGAGHGVPGPISDRELEVLSGQLAAARASTAKYKDVDAAKADGYSQVTQFIPGLGLHMVNLKIYNDGFDPAHPSILLYQPAADGHLILVGVAYTSPHTTDVPPAGFAGGLDVWHFHTNLCFLPNGSVTIAPDLASCKALSGVFQARTQWLLHAWIWKSNPDGLFTESNPQVF